jgi:magnesium-protoporphyrin O-methyltransferase
MGGKDGDEEGPDMPGRCCSPFESAANQQFNEKKVAQELKRYRDNGPGPTTRLLADGITQSGALSGTVLDVGSGVGGLTFALLERGASGAVAVDASTAYVDAARDEAVQRGRVNAIRFVRADFVAAAPQLSSADIVTLDRVVCCYPSCDQLLHAAIDHAERCLALSYPRDVWYVRAAVMLENSQRRLARNPFRTFVHPTAKIEETIRRAGFRLSSRRGTWMWSADVYVRQ